MEIERDCTGRNWTREDFVLLPRERGMEKKDTVVHEITFCMKLLSGQKSDTFCLHAYLGE
jgi:hypothetical protein